LIVACLLACTRADCAAVPESSGSIVRVASWERLNLWVDVSGSLDPQEARRVLLVLGDSAALVPGVSEIALFPFALAADSWRGPATRLTVPQAPSFECGRQLTELASFLVSARNRQAELCAHDAEVARAALIPRLSAYRREWGQTIATLGLGSREAQSTCLLQAVSRACAGPQAALSIVVTDGAHHACPTQVLDRSAAPARTILLLVPGVHDEGDIFARAARRAAAIVAAFPEVEVVPSFCIETASSLPALLASRADRQQLPSPGQRHISPAQPE
jgi:hypothetical protein